MKKIIVISDVDGCLTDGKFVYTAEGKISKTFGPHDNDGVKLLRKNGIETIFISADKRGFPITEKRITDMKCQITCVSETDRADYIKQYIDDGYFVVFFGDGLGDLAAYYKNVVSESIILIAPNNARWQVKDAAAFVTDNNGGEGAFLDLAEWVVGTYVDDDVELYTM
jgi:3-deoxy-D-manno-octulosonate 8-phosphate phosphatase (KDO 8-P phosphatase)